jgi:hypothetical protein
MYLPLMGIRDREYTIRTKYDGNHEFYTDTIQNLVSTVAWDIRAGDLKKKFAFSE